MPSPTQGPLPAPLEPTGCHVRAVEPGDVVGARVAVRVLERPGREEVPADAGQAVDVRRRREPAVGAAGVRADGAPRRPVPLRDVVGLRDAVDVAPRCRRTRRSRWRSGRGRRRPARNCRCRCRSPSAATPALAQVGDVVGGRRCSRGCRTCRPRRASRRWWRSAPSPGRRTVGRVDGRGARRAGGQVAREQVVGGGDARAVLEVAPDVEGRSDDLQGLDVPDRLDRAGCRTASSSCRSRPRGCRRRLPRGVNVPPA